MKYQAHRGVGTECPENTLPAFAAAAEQGYEYIEMDTRFTADGKLVLLHDETMNRTCRNADGSKIEEPLYLEKMTYDEVLQYDAGIAMGEAFKGTKIPLLADVLQLAKEKNLVVKLDNRIQDYTEEQTEELFAIVEQSGATVSFTSAKPEYIQKVVQRFPNAEIHYDGYVDEKKVKEVKGMLINNPLTVWLCLPSPSTSWVTVPKADETLCSMVKNYAKLGLWILETEEEQKQAEMYGADIIETPGQLKP